MLIRNTLKEDLPEITKLYNNRKSEKELEWVFSNPENRDELNSFVAVDKGGKIIGAIGYKFTKYSIENTKISGTVPLSWIVDKNHKGFAGINLFKKTTEIGNFFIGIGGSNDAKNVFPAFKLSPIGSLYSFYKVIKPIKYFKSLKGNKIKNIIRTAVAYKGHLLSKNKIVTEVQLLPFDEEIFSKKPFIKHNIFHKDITANYIKWLLDCPLTDGYAFHIFYKEKYLGELVCFRKKINDIYRGRIVHLSYLGNDKDIWKKVISKIEEFMKSIECASINAVAFNPIVKNIFKKMGYFNHLGHKKTMYIKDSKNVLSNINLSNWHLQYTEGDKSYRNI